MDRTAEIEWDRVGQEQFDRIVDLLLHRRYSSDPDREGVPFSGQGGDQGRDFLVKRGEVVETIYQYKYFPEGFSGGFVKRRSQIKESFTRAMAHNPERWVLITPANVKTYEYDYVKGLGDDYDVVIQVEGRAVLDSEIAKHTDVLDYFTRQPLIETLRVLDKERFALANPDIVASTLVELHRQLDARSPYWGVETTTTAAGTTQTLYAKDPQASAIEPISVTATVPNDSPIWERFREWVEYGSIEGTLVINENGPERFAFEGPEAFTPRSGAGRLEISSVPIPADREEPIELRVVDADSTTVAAIRGRVADVNSGSIGNTLVAAFPGGLTMRFLMPREVDKAGSARITCESDGKDVIAVHRERRALDTAIDGAGAVQLWRSGRLFWGLSVSERPPLPADNDPTLVEDLAVIAKLRDVPLVVPAQLTIAERQTIRTLRLLLDGHCVLVPETMRYTVMFKPEGREAILGILENGGGWRVDQYRVFTVQGHNLRIERVWHFHPSIQITNVDEVRTALDNATGENIKVDIRPTDETPFRAFLPDLVPDPQAPLVPVPLDIVDLPEHPALEQIRSTSTEHNP
ncbi:hypothetical protein [Glycomyces sp. NRRL B-16210]|uniref:hypothetical protein n=1 Tax=Glycomyces sp. NRRL B-16210 TaxID=1463821 RepID=UPI0004BFF3AE|nr:hypothetical protein [Glycomyces sp. NRRL B-16210]